MRQQKNLLLIGFLLFSCSACADNSDSSQATAHATKDKAVKTTQSKGSAGYLKVVGVAANDTLSLRQSGSGKSKLLYKIPPNASGLLPIGEENGWVNLSYQGYTGWAHHKYLAAAPAPTVTNVTGKELHCIGTEPHWILKSDKQQVMLKKFDGDELQGCCNTR